MDENRNQRRIIAMASGKGGTGKTTLATNLARVLEERGVIFIDCDVEEPNGHLFLKPKIHEERPYHTFIPVVDSVKCTACGKCSELCQFNAIATIKDRVLVFPELCHACEGCKLICPEDAISDGRKEVGVIAEGSAGKIHFTHGRLRIGEAMSPPLIREVKRVGFSANDSRVVLIDAPPGTSCPVISAVEGCDFVVLVTEPTPFGLHDLKLAVEMVRVLGIPFGVVINRSTVGDRNVWQYCDDESIPILMEMPDDRDIAVAYSQGTLLVDALPEYQTHFEGLYQRILSHIPMEEKVA